MAGLCLLKCSRASTQHENKRSFEEQLHIQMKQPCPSNHILPVACGKGVVFVLSSECMQNRSVCISINKRALCVCVWHLEWPEQLIALESFVPTQGSAGFGSTELGTEPQKHICRRPAITLSLMNNNGICKPLAVCQYSPEFSSGTG